MLAISLFSLILFLFPIRVSCRTKFLRPPEWDSYVDVRAGLEENIGYQVGDTIQLLWETDLDKVELFLVQEIGSISVHRVLDSSRTEWKAEWDVNGLIKGNEDSLYWFDLKDPGDLEVSIAQTQYFNVTAPELEIHTTLQTSTATQSTTSQTVGVPPTRLIPKPTITDQSSNEEANSDTGSGSGMSKGELAGAAVGGTIGGLILLGVIGCGFSESSTAISLFRDEG
ncbi:hypothetical protein ACKAV7_008148 [Fusarium commune]